MRRAHTRTRKSYDKLRQLRQTAWFSWGSVVRVGGVGWRRRVFEANALEPAHAQPVAPFVQPARDEQIGKAALCANKLACGFSPLLPVVEQLCGQRLGVGLAHAALIEPAAQSVLGFEILLGRFHHTLRRG